MTKKKQSFEDALKGLEKSAEALMKPGITLEEALKNYETGIAYYNQCNEILSDAKQKIEIYGDNHE